MSLEASCVVVTEIRVVRPSFVCGVSVAIVHLSPVVFSMSCHKFVPFRKTVSEDPCTTQITRREQV